MNNQIDQLMRWSQQARQLLGDEFWNDIMTTMGNAGGRTEGGPWGASLGGSSNIRADVYDSGKEYVALFELPGIENAEAIDLYVEGDRLFVKATVKSIHEAENYVVQERTYGAIERVITFPQPVRRDGTTARYRNGLLEVRVQKTDTDRRDRQRVRVSL